MRPSSSIMASRLSLAEIKQLLSDAEAEEALALIRSLEGDERAGVVRFIEATKRRLDEEQAERERVEGMYSFDRAQRLQEGAMVLGLDEVGRGPLAGPLAVGGVVLDLDGFIPGLNDSKLLSASQRERIAHRVNEASIACTVRYVEPSRIDEVGMSASLKEAFRGAIEDVAAQGIPIDVILLDGNALHLDDRERNVIKGDRQSASIAAASIIAKVARDALMDGYDEEYPVYGFRSNKGYGTQAHIDAIRLHGLSPLHRSSFCRGFAQESLF